MTIKVELPDESVWAAISFIFVWICIAAYRFFVWRPTLLTKDEHTAICTKNQSEIKSSQDDIKGMLQEQNRDSAGFRKDITLKIESVGSDVGALKTDVAVLKATQPTTQVNVGAR